MVDLFEAREGLNFANQLKKLTIETALFLFEDIRLVKYAPGRSINLALSTRGKVALETVGCGDCIYNQGIPMYGRYIHNVDGKSFNIQPYGMKNEVKDITLFVEAADDYSNFFIAAYFFDQSQEPQ